MSVPDIRFEFLKQRSLTLEKNKYEMAYAGPIARRTTEPRWPEVKIELDKLCQGDKTRPFCIEIRSPKNGRRWGISRPLTVNSILNNQIVELFESEKEKAKRCGILKVEKASVFERPAFTDYLRSGW